MTRDPIPYRFDGAIRTDFTGFRQLLRFYTELKTHYHRTIQLDFSQLDFFEASLSAVLCAFMHKLGKDNDLRFEANYEHLSEQFEGVLIRNGCFRPNGQRVDDNRQSTVLCTHFTQDDEKPFKQYIERDLFAHRGLAELKRSNPNATRHICTDLLEIFENYRSHACTDEPFFVCGQYYPQQKKVQFTMTDLGVGFLGPIRDFTNGDIQTDLDAINWAVAGKSTRPDTGEPNGCGLEGIYEFCQRSGSHIQIVTGNIFWATDLKETIFGGHRGFDVSFVGSTITILFNGVDRL